MTLGSELKILDIKTFVRSSFFLDSGAAVEGARGPFPPLFSLMKVFFQFLIYMVYAKDFFIHPHYLLLLTLCLIHALSFSYFITCWHSFHFPLWTVKNISTVDKLSLINVSLLPLRFDYSINYGGISKVTLFIDLGEKNENVEQKKMFSKRKCLLVKTMLIFYISTDECSVYDW